MSEANRNRGPNQNETVMIYPYELSYLVITVGGTVTMGRTLACDKPLTDPERMMAVRKQLISEISLQDQKGGAIIGAPEPKLIFLMIHAYTPHRAKIVDVQKAAADTGRRLEQDQETGNLIETTPEA